MSSERRIEPSSENKRTSHAILALRACLPHLSKAITAGTHSCTQSSQPVVCDLYVNLKPPSYATRRLFTFVTCNQMLTICGPDFPQWGDHLQRHDRVFVRGFSTPENNEGQRSHGRKYLKKGIIRSVDRDGCVVAFVNRGITQDPKRVRKEQCRLRFQVRTKKMFKLTTTGGKLLADSIVHKEIKPR